MHPSGTGLQPGSRLGAYEIVGLLGAGGMGEVYRAVDTKLRREVAIKSLPVTLANDAQYMARFEREAQILAALNHPNIATVFGTEQGALVMELVEGQTLAERIAQGPLATDEAMAVALQIAAALEAAHEKGIVHRDLKPANVKVTPTGIVKVLDFGLAKTAESAPQSMPANSPTLTLQATEAGLILGTAGYMSPEQAAGKPVDRRADIWAFGVVVWEMLTGKAVFSGETVAHTLAAVLTKDFTWSSLPASTPRAIVSLLRRCLDRDLRTRLRDIGEARIAIERYKTDDVPAAAAETVHSSRRNRAWVWPAVAAVSLAAALVTGLMLWKAKHPLPQPLLQFDVVANVKVRQGPTNSLAISPDGSRIVIVGDVAGKPQLFSRGAGEMELTPIAGTEGGEAPFFAPNGQSIGFFADGQLKRAFLGGGPPIVICPAPRGRGGTWTHGGLIVFAPDIRSVLYRVPDTGGTPEPFTTFDAALRETNHRWPVSIQGTDVLLFVAHYGGGSYDKANIIAQSLRTGKRKVVVQGGTYPSYAGGYLFWVNNSKLLAAPFDLSSLELAAPAIPGPQSIFTSNGGAAAFALSSTGVAVCQADETKAAYRLGWLEKGGRLTPVTGELINVVQISVSPDERRAALVVERENRRTIWVQEFERGTQTRLSPESRGWSTDPVWSPDGKYIVYGYADKEGNEANPRLVKIIRGDGASPPRPLIEHSHGVFPTAFTSDGQSLLVVYHDTGDQRDPDNPIGVVPVDWTGANGPTAGKLKPFGVTSGRFHDLSISPDGRWIAHGGELGDEVFVRPFQGGGGKWSIGRGAQPQWSARGLRLFYNTPEGQQVVDYSTSSEAFVFGKSQLWAPRGSWGVRINFGVPVMSFCPRSERWLISYQENADQKQSPIRALVNLPDEIRRRYRELRPRDLE